jgi:aminopeptidase N
MMGDPGYSLSKPNKVYALLGMFFRANLAEFHSEDGLGYEMWADQVIALDAKNPQVASRMARALENWRRYTPSLQVLIRGQLERVAAADGLSSDVAEIIEMTLAD